MSQKKSSRRGNRPASFVRNDLFTILMPVESRRQLGTLLLEHFTITPTTFGVDTSGLMKVEGRIEERLIELYASVIMIDVSNRNVLKFKLRTDPLPLNRRATLHDSTFWIWEGTYTTGHETAKLVSEDMRMQFVTGERK
ncbi:MAG: hypothetical protein ABIR91_05980 [Candidatus Saccharimonadales bacterium]